MDHMPITTTIEISPGRQATTPKPNFKATNWPYFQKELTKKLANYGPLNEIRSETEFYNRLSTLTAAIVDTTKATVQKTNPLPFTKCWWSKELAQKHTEVCRLGRNSCTKRSNPDEPAHKAYKAARNTYRTMIKTVKKTHWEDFLQSVNDNTIWTAHR